MKSHLPPLLLALLLCALLASSGALCDDEHHHYSIGEQVYNLHLLKSIYSHDNENDDDNDDHFDMVQSDSAASILFKPGALPPCERSIATSGPTVAEHHTTAYDGLPIHYPAYRQFIKADNGKYVGCGATAWAMAAAWYAHHPTLLRGGGGGGSHYGDYLRDRLPLVQQDRRTEAHMERIGRAVKSFSNIFMGKNTATMPWDMPSITALPEYSTAVMDGVSHSYWVSIVTKRKCPLGDIWDCAVARIKQGRPVVIGYGGGVSTHYALARAYVRHTDGQEWIYLNNGWGGSHNGWLNRRHGLFFAGYFNK